MEEKGIVLSELSCRTAAELPPPDCCRSFGGSSGWCTPGAELPRAAPRRSCGTTAEALAAVQLPEYIRRSCGTAAEASAAVRWGELGDSPFLLHVVVQN